MSWSIHSTEEWLSTNNWKKEQWWLKCLLIVGVVRVIVRVIAIEILLISTLQHQTLWVRTMDWINGFTLFNPSCINVLKSDEYVCFGNWMIVMIGLIEVIVWYKRWLLLNENVECEELIWIWDYWNGEEWLIMNWIVMNKYEDMKWLNDSY